MRRLAAPLLAAALLVSGCSSSSGLQVQGNVDDDLVVVTVPALAVPSVDLDAGFASSPTASSGAPGTAADQGAGFGLGSFVGVTAVSVREGDQVAAGQELAQLDDSLLRAGLKAAEADAAAARVQLDVLDDRIQDTEDAEAEIAEKRADVVKAIDDLTDTRADLVRQRTKLRTTRAELAGKRSGLRSKRSGLAATRAELVARRQQAEDALAQLPGEGTPLPPGTPTREELEAAIAQLSAAIEEADAGLGQLNGGLAELNKGLRQLDDGLAKMADGLRKIDEGLRSARDGLRKLDDARADVLDARAQLTRLRRLAEIAADTGQVPVDQARAQLAQAVITAPVAGTVVSVAATGDRLAPGATLVAIRPSGPVRLVAWLSPAQTARVCAGDPATVWGDWMAADETVGARLTRIATAADFPPTSQATDEVHLTRAFRVELTSDTALPAGVPVTISLQPCQPAAPAAPRK